MKVDEFKNNQHKLISKLHSITLPRILLSIFFGISLFIIFGVLYNWEFKVSSFLLYLSFLILFSPIFFVKDVFHPIYIFISIQILPLINFLDKDLNESPLRYATYVSGDDLTYILSYSILIIIVWFIFLYIGFIISNQTTEINFSYKKHFSKEFCNPQKVAIILLIFAISSYMYILYDIGGVSAMLKAMSQRVETYSGKTYLINIVRLGSLSSILLLYSGKHKTSILINLLTFLAMSTFGGREGAFFGVVFPFLIFYNFYYKKINMRSLIFLISLGVIFGITWGNFRHYGDLGFRDVEIGGLLFQIAKGKATGDILPSLLYLLLNGQIEYNLGKSMINIFFAPIPRSIWPSKPLIDETGVVGRAIMGSDHWGLPPRSYGYAFFNFHWIGVIMLATITGVIIRKLYNKILTADYNKKNSFWLILFYAFNIRHFFNVFSTSAQINIIWNVFVFVVIFVLDKLFTKNRKLKIRFK